MKRKLIVVKIGTSSLTGESGELNKSAIENLVSQVAEIVNEGHRVILVTSAAVAAGMAELKVKPNPKDLVFKQACAATGQSILMSYYREFFRSHKLKVAQILLTKEDLSNRLSYLHICNVIDRLLRLGVIPIINENDVTSIDELIPVTKSPEVNFSDNDILSVLIANATEADIVVILSDIDGLYNRNPEDPEAKLIPTVEKVSVELIESMEGRSSLGRGGIKTKLQAAEIATQSGIPLVLANSKRKNVLSDILANRRVGTLFKPIKKLAGRKRWIAYGANAKGEIIVNNGAKRAMLEGASLLAVGTVRVKGRFDVGDVIRLVDEEGKVFGKGISNYTSEEISTIKGIKTSQIRKNLGYIRQKEIVIRKHVHLVMEEKE